MSFNPYDFYITPEEFDQAAANGVNKRVLEVRVRQLGWSKEASIATPVQSRRKYGEWTNVAQSNGVPYGTFKQRVQRGWTLERAATTPFETPERRREIVDHARSFQRKYDPGTIQRAAAVGIKSDLFYMRVRRGWDVERAASEPRWSQEETGLYTRFGKKILIKAVD